MWKFKYRFRCYCRLVWDGTISPIMDSPATLLPIPASIYISFLFGGAESVNTEIEMLLKAAFAFLLTMPFWFLINLIISPFKVLRDEKKNGTWIGDRFLYHSAIHVKTLLINQCDDGKSVRFTVPFAPPCSFVQFKIDNEGGMGTICLTNHENNHFDWGTGQVRCGVRLNKKNEVVAQIKIPQQSSETISTISMLYWEK